MRQHVAALTVAILNGGCSVIFSSGNIPAIQFDAAPDVVIDAPFDANPSLLMLTSAAPSELFEGQGDGGSRPAILVIHGSNFVAGAQVAITAGSAVSLAIDNAHVRIPVTSDYLAVPVTAHVDLSIPDGQLIPLTIQVTQPLPGGGTTMMTLPGALMLRGLDELTSLPAMANTSVLKRLYSQVRVPNASTAFVGTTAVVIRAVSSITFATAATPPVPGAITAVGGNASAAAGGSGGPGGCNGGPGAGAGACAGKGGAGATSMIVGTGGGGGGAGFATTGMNGGGTGPGAGGAQVGDAMISSYSTNQGGGGGGGGNGSLSANGGGGGGGGGIVELTAGGDVTVGTINVTGGNGAAFSGGALGGGGSGGVVLVRSGRTLTTGMLTSLGGNTTNGAGSPGRIRWDGPTGTMPTANPVAARGPAFATNPLVLTGTAVHLVGAPSTRVDVYAVDGMGVTHPGLQGVFDADTTATINPPLEKGYNKVCVTLMGGSQQAVEANTCIEVAYLP